MFTLRAVGSALEAAPRISTCILNQTRCLAAAAASSSPNSYCMDLVRKHDYEGYLCTLWLPKELHSDAFALRAFNVELALVRESVKDDKLGAIRLEFWRTVVKENSGVGHPVAMALHAAMGQRRLTQAFLTRMITARQTHFSETAYADIPELEKYSEQTNVSLLYLLLETAGLRKLEIDHATSHVGKALGMVTLLRATPFLAKRGKVRLPLALLAKHKVSQTSVLRGEGAASLADAVHELASMAHTHLQTANRSELPSLARSVLLPAAPARLYLDKLEKANFDVFAPTLTQTGFGVPFCIAKAALRGRLM
eukprot:m.18322 g.18322  ORF g.18322 m.18322 type:complete len:310 (-) comp7333_c0_seq1:24-953(-)